MPTQTKSPIQKFTLEEFERRFPDENACLDWLRNKLYPSEIYCPNCKIPTKHHRISQRKVYGCDYCGHQISPTAGTIFHKSSTPLRIWLYVIFQMALKRGSISAKQIERETGVTYKTAWRMRKEIRKRLGEEHSVFSDDIKVNDTYVSGKREPET